VFSFYGSASARLLFFLLIFIMCCILTEDGLLYPVHRLFLLAWNVFACVLDLFFAFIFILKFFLVINTGGILHIHHSAGVSLSGFSIYIRSSLPFYLSFLSRF